MPRTTLIGLLMCLMLTACEGESAKQAEPEAATEPAHAESPQLSSNLEMCSEEQRPEMCAQFYKPVCGQLKDSAEKASAEQQLDSEWKTYGNACTACADHQVVGYKPGACDEQD